MAHHNTTVHFQLKGRFTVDSFCIFGPVVTASTGQMIHFVQKKTALRCGHEFTAGDRSCSAVNK